MEGFDRGTEMGVVYPLERFTRMHSFVGDL